MRKKSLLILLLIPVVLVAAAYLLIDTAKLKPILESTLSTSLHRGVHIGELKLSLFPPGLEAAQLVIDDDPSFSQKPFLTAATLRVRPSLLPLLRGAVEVRSIELSSPKVELIQNASKKWNYESMLGNDSQSDSSSFSLAHLLIENATLAVAQPGEPLDTYSNIGLELQDFSKGKPFFLRVSATLPEGEKASLEGKVTSAGVRTSFDEMTVRLASLKGALKGTIDDGKLDIHLDIPQAPIADLTPLFLPKAMKASGQIAAKIDVSGTTAKPAVAGHLTATQFEVSGGEIRQPVTTPKISIQLTPAKLTLEPATVISGSTQIQAQGTVSNYAEVPNVDLSIQIPSAQIAELLSIARVYGVRSVEGIQATGAAKLQMRIQGEVSKKSQLDIAGSGAISGARFELPSLTKPLAIQNAELKFEENSAALSGLDVSFGSTKAQGSLRIASFRQPDVRFDLTADKVNLDELLAAVKQDPSPRKESGSARMTAEGSIAIGTFELSGLTLTQLTSKLSYANNHAILNPLNAKVYSGTHTGSMDVDLKADPPVYSLNSKLDKIESSQLLAATTALKGIISGPFSGNLGLKFSPGEPVKMAKSLNGNISLKFEQGRIASFNLTNELNALAKFMGFNPNGDKFTQFVGLTGDLVVANGSASTQNLKLDLANLTASLTGSMNLADQTLNMKLISLLDRKFSEQVGGNKIGGFMTAALANQSGNLMIPASISGTFAKPVLAPDPAAIAKMKLQSFNPKDPKQMLDSVNGVLDLFKKKKPAEEQKP